jgi:tetratricopeptide (TPR) repeat protein
MVMLLPIMAAAEEPTVPPPPAAHAPPAANQQQANPEQPAAGQQQPANQPQATTNGQEPAATPEQPAVPPAQGQATAPPEQAPTPQPTAQSPQTSPSMGTVAPPLNRGATWNSDLANVRMAPSTSEPLAYSASRSEAALRIQDLMQGAAALRTQGNYAKAMELYNQVLTIAPQYPEAYRQRALTLVQLGNRVQAQADYDRFLSLDPRTPDRVREEVTLFEQSGLAQGGAAAAASYNYGPTLIGPPSPWPQAAEEHLSWAEHAFQNRDYDRALRWAAQSNKDMPQARTHALMAQLLFAQGDFPGAAAQARAAIAMRPVTDWRTLYSDYAYTAPRLARQFAALQEFVRQNPSSYDGHFLLGYQDLILGQTGPGHAELAIAAVIEPTDVAATSLLARDGVEIVNSHRPLARAALPNGGVQVAQRPSASPTNVPPLRDVPPPPAAGTTGTPGTSGRGVIR